MKSMYMLDCASTGAVEISWFHQLFDGNSARVKSSVSLTVLRAGGGDEGGGSGSGAGAGDGAGDGDGAGEGAGDGDGAGAGVCDGGDAGGESVCAGDSLAAFETGDGAAGVTGV